MGDDHATIAAEHDGALILRLSTAAARAFVAAIALGHSAVFLVDFFQERALVIEGLQVQATGEVHLTLVLDRVPRLGVVLYEGATVPVILGGVGHVSPHPIEYGDVLQGQGVGHVESLVVSQRRTEVSDALLDGVFPNLIVGSVELLIHLHVWFFNAGVGASGEVYVQVGERAPADAKGAIPVEAAAEGDGQGVYGRGIV